mgnify:CR=1 FL=1
MNNVTYYSSLGALHKHCNGIHEDIRAGAHQRLNDLEHFRVNRATCRRATGCMIDDTGQYCVFNAGFTRQSSFRHSGHTDHRAAIALESIDFGCRLEPWPLRHGVYTATDPDPLRLATGLERRADFS